MMVNTPPCLSRATSRPSLNTYAAMKKPTMTDSKNSRTIRAFMPDPYHQAVSDRRKKD